MKKDRTMLAKLVSNSEATRKKVAADLRAEAARLRAEAARLLEAARTIEA